MGQLAQSLQEAIFFFFSSNRSRSNKFIVVIHINDLCLHSITAQEMKFSVKDFFSKCDQIRSFLRIWSHLLKKSLMENFIFCAVYLAIKAPAFLVPVRGKFSIPFHSTKGFLKVESRF